MVHVTENERWKYIPGLEWTGDLAGRQGTGTVTVQGPRGTNQKMTISKYRLCALLTSGLEHAAGVPKQTNIVGELVMRSITATLQAACNPETGIGAVGQLHLSYRQWFKTNLRIDLEALQTPCTASTIFARTSFIKGSIPQTDEQHWGENSDGTKIDVAIEAPLDQKWQEGCWEQNCIVYIRAGEEPMIVDGAIQRAYRTAKRKRCILVLEIGPMEAWLENAHRKAAAEDELFTKATVEVIPLITFPKGTTLWTGSGGEGSSWYIDTNGLFQGTEEDGNICARRTAHGSPIGQNRHRVEATLYCPKEGPEAYSEISDKAIRDLTMIASNVSMAMTPNGKAVLPRFNGKGDDPKHLNLYQLPPGDDFDPYAAARVLAWQPHVANIPVGANAKRFSPTPDGRRTRFWKDLKWSRPGHYRRGSTLSTGGDDVSQTFSECRG
jgi:hypothetical protein